MTLEEIRKRAGRSRVWVAVQAGVSEPTVRLHEADPETPRDWRKREALLRVYAELRKEVGA